MGGDVVPSLPLKFDPCGSCDRPCLKVCPQNAFEKAIYDKDVLMIKELPGRSGNYDRNRCGIQMEQDFEKGEYTLNLHP